MSLAMSKIDYKKEAEEWQKHYDSLPCKGGMYAPLFKRSEHESDEEYVKNCEEASTLMCCIGAYSSGDKSIQKKVKDYMDKTYSDDWIINQFIKIGLIEMKEPENER